jgi:hypothetical protein
MATSSDIVSKRAVFCDGLGSHMSMYQVLRANFSDSGRGVGGAVWAREAL